MTSPKDDRPTAMDELRTVAQWVVWRTEDRDGKPTKAPYVARRPSRRASSTDAETWGSHEDAARAVAEGRAAGVGFVFSAEDGYAGVDLDKCVTAGVVHPGALDVVRRLDSYTELSPTGSGLHVIVRAGIDGDRKRTVKTPWGGDFESYDRGRFFTVTALPLPGTPAIINVRQRELDAVRAELFPAKPARRLNLVAAPASDDEILRRARAARNGADFDALYRGDISKYDGDESAADLALCNMLAFWAGGPDAARIDGLFRDSGLMRDKWDSPRPGGTYGSQTIDKALDGRTEYVGQPAAPAKAVGRSTAMTELASILTMDDNVMISSVVASGHDSKARVDLVFDDGRSLHLDPLAAYTTAAKLNAEIAFQLGVEASVSKTTRVFALLRNVCEYREEFTRDERAIDFGISYLQEAPEREVAMSNQAERWDAFVVLAGQDPGKVAKERGTSVAAESIVLRDQGTHLRYVRAVWFAAYVRAQASAGVADDVVHRMRVLGWAKPGAEGRMKASPSEGQKGRPLIWAFYVVPVDWERA